MHKSDFEKQLEFAYKNAAKRAERLKQADLNFDYRYFIQCLRHQLGLAPIPRGRPKAETV